MPSGLLGNSEFLSVIYRERRCAGGVVSTAAGLQALRFCTVIDGDLELRGLNTSDYAPLRWINTIEGSLRIEDNAGLVSLADFRRLTAVQGAGSRYTVGNATYKIVIASK